MPAPRLAQRTLGSGDDLVERIVRAVTEGDGPTLDVLLAVLEAVADEPLLRRLSAEMRHMPTPVAPAWRQNTASRDPSGT
ncbi:hypothetical protein ACIQWA_07045 [Kitasatospora sp. NPDC098652]|uniref:hypothetical protein n=1 Tax=Kitasatospora sp. NPDC098652 TaxID=3364095 RepID=UPI0037FF0860